ncbi:MAG: hypothetical protein WAK20_00585, partial [Candidatus Acidiferrum sp.]
TEAGLRLAWFSTSDWVAGKLAQISDTRACFPSLDAALSRTLTPHGKFLAHFCRAPVPMYRLG